jgi:chitin synthase
VDIGDGLISLFKKDNNSFGVSPKIAICITIYNENRLELEKTLNGLLENLIHFKKNGIENH